MNHKNKRQKDKMKHIQPFEQFMNEKSGGTGHLANAKYYWKIFNKKQKIDFLVGAGYSKSVANDLSNEDWDSLEIEVHKNLASVLENFVNEAEYVLDEAYDGEKGVLLFDEVGPELEAFRSKIEKLIDKSTDDKWINTLKKTMSSLDRLENDLAKADNKLGVVPVNEAVSFS
jgi:hypothetical protein